MWQPTSAFGPDTSCNPIWAGAAPAPALASVPATILLSPPCHPILPSSLPLPSPAAFQVRFIYNFLPRVMRPLWRRRHHNGAHKVQLRRPASTGKHWDPCSLWLSCHCYMLIVPFDAILPFCCRFFSQPFSLLFFAIQSGFPLPLKRFGCCNRNRITAAVKICKWWLTKRNASS